MIKTTEQALAQLNDLLACAPALKWVAKQPDAATAWAKCCNPLYMSWLLAMLRQDGLHTDNIRVVALTALRPYTRGSLLTAVDQCIDTGGQRLVPNKQYVADRDRLIWSCCRVAFLHTLVCLLVQVKDGRRTIFGGKKLCNLIRKYYPTWPEKK